MRVCSNGLPTPFEQNSECKPHHLHHNHRNKRISLTSDDKTAGIGMTTTRHTKDRVYRTGDIKVRWIYDHPVIL